MYVRACADHWHVAAPWAAEHELIRVAPIRCDWCDEDAVQAELAAERYTKAERYGADR